ncbi:MAG: S9 family peptidase [Thermomicrobiales bacterium]|nr:S9 family peptidase [Thermomicrobiales bacterium]
MTETAMPQPRPGALALEELVDRIVPEDPRIAPDGSVVAFVAGPAGRTEEHAARTIWLGREGAPARKLTAGGSDDRAPRWSPDGTRLAFLSDRVERGETSGLYILPLAGGEAMRLGDLAGDLDDPHWSPDGSAIAVRRTDPVPADKKAREKARDDAIVVEAEPRFTRLWLIDVATGAARCLTTADREVRAHCWLPDGSALAIVTTALPGWNELFNGSKLRLVPVAGGRARALASFPLLAHSPVAVTLPEGEGVAVAADGGRQDPPTSVWVVPLAGGEPRNLTPGFAGEVEQLVAIRDRRNRIAIKTVERVRGVIRELDLATGGLTDITPIPLRGRGSVQTGVSLSADGRRLACIWTDSSTPEEVYLGEAAGSATAVTEFGASFAGRLQPADVVRWVSDDGVEIEGLLVYPAGYQAGQRYPLIVEIHGGPSWQWEDRVMLDWHDWAQLLASRGFAVLLPNPRGSTAYGAEFQKLLQDDVGGGESRDLVAGAKAMVERGIADPERLGIGGWSWGGYLTAWTLTQTDIFKAAMMGAGLANLVSDHGTDDIPHANLLYFPGHPYHHLDVYWNASPIRHIAQVATPTLILHGDNDDRVPPTQGAEYWRALTTLGVPVEFVRYPREPHVIRERAHQLDLMRRLAGWCERWLGLPRAGADETKPAARSSGD